MSADPVPAVHDTGSGPALLMLHAFPLEASQWDHQVAALSGAHRCLRSDMWGCGASPPPPDATPSLDAYAIALLARLDAAGVERFTVLGSSMGGYLGFALWRLAASRIDGLVLIGTRADSDSAERREQREQQAARLLEELSVEPLVDAFATRLVATRNEAEVHLTDPLRGRIRRCTPRGAAYALRAMAARPDSSALLGSINVPVLVLAGVDDRVIPPEESRRMAQALPQAELIEMPGCGHLPNLEAPPVVTAAVERFLRR